MAILRKQKTGNFTTVNNYFINDPNLKPDGKGFLLFMLSKPDDWKFNFINFQKSLGIGQKAVRSLVNKLEQLKYLKRERIRDEFGHYEWNYFVYEEPYDLVQKDNESILYFSDIDTRIYINFKSDYFFDNLPNGFNRTKKWDDNRKEWVIDESKCVKGIEKYISFYNGNQKKTSDEIEEEIKKSNIDIYNWVKKLPIKESKECLNQK